MTKKQFIVGISIVSALAVAVAVVFFSVFAKPNAQDAVARTVELSGDELRSVETASSSFLQEATNFGINLDSISSETAAQRMMDIAEDNGGTSWVKRTEVASRLVSERVDLSGDLSFSLDRIANADYTDSNLVTNFRSSAMDVTANSKASYIFTDKSEPIKIARVQFSGSSVLSHFSQDPNVVHTHGDEEVQEDHDAEFTLWQVKEQTVDVSGELTLSRENDAAAWRVRAIDFKEGEFALTFWGPDAFTTSYPGFELGGTVVREVEFPNKKVETNVPR